MNIFQFFRNKYYKNREMVSYWKTKDKVEAKLVKTPGGHYEMYMQGEKYPFPGYPRDVLLYGSLSKLKHEIKNQVFNASWAMLEDGISYGAVSGIIKRNVLPEIYKIAEKGKYDMVPFELLNPPVKEIWRAMTAIEGDSVHIKNLKQIICFILQEDDAYRMRFQWIVKFFNPNAWWRRLFHRDPIKDLDFALSMLEQAEVIGDMKERQRLFRRIVLVALKDEAIRAKFDALIRELDWSKLKLTKADKYFFRAKYFKVDFPEYQY